MKTCYLQGCILLICCMSFFNASAQSLIPCDLKCATTQLSGDVELEWTPSTESCGAFIEYIIFYGDGSGSYTTLDFITDESTTTYTHVGADGAVNTWCYYIEALYDCAGYLVTQSDTLCNTDPEPPVIDYVTITSSGVSINWLPGTSSKTDAYIIYRDIGGFTAIATVYGRYTTNYVDATADAQHQVETYTIASVDACGNAGPFNTASHHTVHLNAEQAGCSDTMLLTWNPYDTWPAGVTAYEIWVSVNFMLPVLVASLPASSSSYAYTGLNDDDHFDFTVYAVRAGDLIASHSNSPGFDVDVTESAVYNVMRNVTVNNNDVDVAWYPDAAADLRDFTIQRSEDGISFINLFTIPVTSPVSSPDIITDPGTDPSAFSYYYRTIITDSCGNTLSSGIARTILLHGTANDNFTNDLSWNKYEMDNATVTAYNIYRNDGVSLSLINSVDASVTTYSDDVAPIITLTDSACYTIEALYELNTTVPALTEQLTSTSNIVCLAQDPRIFVPNAIIPGTANGIFRPVIIFGEDKSFSMQIFNRYGEKLFESSDVLDGWDGTYKGELVPLGTYAYLISFTATNGELIRKKGNISVVR